MDIADLIKTLNDEKLLAAKRRRDVLLELQQQIKNEISKIDLEIEQIEVGADSDEETVEEIVEEIPKDKNLVSHLITPEYVYDFAILEELENSDLPMKRGHFINKIPTIVDLKQKDEDEDKLGRPRWKRNANWSVHILFKHGFIRKTAKSYYAITESGREFLAAGVPLSDRGC